MEENTRQSPDAGHRRGRLPAGVVGEARADRPAPPPPLAVHRPLIGRPHHRRRHARIPRSRPETPGCQAVGQEDHLRPRLRLGRPASRPPLRRRRGFSGTEHHRTPLAHGQSDPFVRRLARRLRDSELVPRPQALPDRSLHRPHILDSGNVFPGPPRPPAPPPRPTQSLAGRRDQRPPQPGRFRSQHPLEKRKTSGSGDFIAQRQPLPPQNLPHRRTFGNS